MIAPTPPMDDAEAREKAARLIAEWACVNYDDLQESRASERPSGPYPQWHASAFPGRHFQGGKLDLLDLVDKIAAALPRCSCPALVEALQRADRVLHFDLRKMITWGPDFNQAVKDAADSTRATLAAQRAPRTSHAARLAAQQATFDETWVEKAERIQSEIARLQMELQDTVLGDPIVGVSIGTAQRAKEE